MSALLDTPQLIGPDHDEEMLRRLSMAQNGAAAISPRKDEAGAVIGFTSPYAVDLSGYDALMAAALAALKSDIKAQVDAKAETLRQALLTPGSGQVIEYQEAYAEAVAVETALQANAGATFDPARFPMLAASIGHAIDPSTNKPTVDVPGEARAVLAAYEACQKAVAAIRSARLKGKAAIDAAASAAAAQAALAAIVWPTFG